MGKEKLTREGREMRGKDSNIRVHTRTDEHIWDWEREGLSEPFQDLCPHLPVGGLEQVPRQTKQRQ